MDIKRLLREELAFNVSINEIDWANTFKDVQQTCVNPEIIVDYLNKVIANADLKYGEREKFSKKKPFFHSKSTLFKKGSSSIDIDDFIKKITQKPKTVVNTNDKMLKSGGAHEFVYKTGIPALRGLVYDIENKKFHYVNTCPGAGTCVAICYAMKGNYIRYAAAYDSLTRRLNYLMNFPDKYEEQMYLELKAKAKEHKAFEGYKNKVILRWNDSGDFFAKRYIKIAEDVIAKLKAEGYNVESYAYTKISSFAKDSKEIDTTFSKGASSKEVGSVDLTKNKVSEVIPKELFADLDLMKISDERELKKRIAKSFNLNLKDIITYDEMKELPKGNKPKWHVIVTPDDGDDAAFRKDVKTVMLTQH